MVHPDIRNVQIISLSVILENLSGDDTIWMLCEMM